MAPRCSSLKQDAHPIPSKAARTLQKRTCKWKLWKKSHKRHSLGKTQPLQQWLHNSYGCLRWLSLPGMPGTGMVQWVKALALWTRWSESGIHTMVHDTHTHTHNSELTNVEIKAKQWAYWQSGTGGGRAGEHPRTAQWFTTVRVEERKSPCLQFCAHWWAHQAPVDSSNPMLYRRPGQTRGTQNKPDSQQSGKETSRDARKNLTGMRGILRGWEVGN